MLGAALLIAVRRPDRTSRGSGVFVDQAQPSPLENQEPGVVAGANCTD